MASEQRYVIEPLKGAENYLSWQVQMEDILVDMQLYDYVDGTETLPNDKTAAAAWAKKDRKALTAIRLRVSSSVISHVASATTSKDAWDALKSVFSAEGAMGKAVVRRKLMKYTIEESEGAIMEEEVRKLRNLKEEFTLLGGTMADDEFALTIVTALPRSWDSFVQALGATIPSSNVVIGRILQEEARRRDNIPSALVAQHEPAREYRKPIICYRCRREGHKAADCNFDPVDAGDTTTATFVRYDEDYAF